MQLPQAPKALVSRPRGGERPRHVQFDDVDASFPRHRDASVGRPRIDINHSGPNRGQAVETGNQTLTFVAADYDDTDSFRVAHHSSVKTARYNDSKSLR